MIQLKCLVLHGNESVRGRIITHLQELGSFDTRHFATGRDAREACREFLPDIVILDSSALDIGTSELVERLRQSSPHQRLVLTSAKSAPPHAGLLRKEANAVLWSPFRRWEFQQAVQDQVSALSEIQRAS